MNVIWEIQPRFFKHLFGFAVLPIFCQGTNPDTVDSPPALFEQCGVRPALSASLEHSRSFRILSFSAQRLRPSLMNV